VAFSAEECVHLLTGDLFLVHRAQDDRGGARVFERLDHAEVLVERPRSDDQRMWQAQAQVRRAEIHHFSSGPEGPDSPGAAKAGTVMPASC
jgi:hypothetical protein